MQYSHCAHDTAKLGAGRAVGRAGRRWAWALGSAQQAREYSTDARGRTVGAWQQAGARGARRQQQHAGAGRRGRAGVRGRRSAGALGVRGVGARGERGRQKRGARGARGLGAGRAACAHGLGQLGARAPGLVFNLVFRLGFFFLSH